MTLYEDYLVAINCIGEGFIGALSKTSQINK